MLLRSPGGPALSAFRVEKWVEHLDPTGQASLRLQADYLHLVQLSGPLSTASARRLQALLTYGEESAREPLRGGSRYIVARPGTVSPWSTKATEILRQCGLEEVIRVERGRVLSWEGAVEPDVLIAALHDRMTEAVFSDPDDLGTLFDVQAPRPLRTIPWIDEGSEALEETNARMGLALSEAELAYLANAYQRLGRDPTDVELMMFAQANSEHCRHKVFNAGWSLDGSPQRHSLFQMIRHTHAANPGGVLSAYKDNSAVIRGREASRWISDPEGGAYRAVREPVHILMKVETHNHPTAISPEPGAATGNGGEIRDEGATGRGGKPKAGLTGFSVSHLRIPGWAQPWEGEDPGRPERIASPLSIMIEGPLGGAAYNNEFGRPNLAGYFRTLEQRVEGPRGPEVRGYHKPIMIAGGMGNIREDHVQKLPVPAGALIVVLGGPAMLIGLGGGAASSQAQGQGAAALDFASVQRANPEMQRRCQEVLDRCVALGEDNPILSVHDVGAGGLSNAIPEIVHDAGKGARLQLREVPSAEPGLSPMEIWCNEAQERYVLCVNPEQLARFQALCERERCPWAVVGEVTDSPHLLMEDSLLGQKPIDLPMGVLFGDTPKMHREAKRRRRLGAPFVTAGLDLAEAAHRVLRLPAVASKAFLITIGDRSISGLVARDQMVGPWQVPVADVAVTLAGFQDYTGEAMAMGERAPLALLDAPASGRMAVGEALTNLAAADVEALDEVVLSANWMAAVGEAGEEADLYETVRAVGLELCPALGIAIPVGKDSLSMRTLWEEGGTQRAVTSPISLVISAFAPVVDARRTLTPALRPGASALLLVDLGEGRDRLGGSALCQVYGALGEVPPDLDRPELLRSFFEAIRALRQAGDLWAYHDRSDGGLFATLCEMAFAGRCGLQIDLDDLGEELAAALFSEELGAVLQVDAERLEAVEARLEEHGLRGIRVGHRTEDGPIRFLRGGAVVLQGERADWQQAWSETSYRVAALRDDPECARQEFDALKVLDDPGLSERLTFDPTWRPSVRAGRPRVAILREQGVNGQLEMAAAFDHAGFEAVDVHMSDLRAGRARLDDFVGLAACGGFSYGDVLGAGGGWARGILYDDALREAFQRFFHRSDAFALGVCNGCQMFSQLRALIPGAESWPRFVRNRSEQFEARISSLRVEPSPSVLFAGMAGSVIPVAVAHGEGRAVFAEGQRARSESLGLISARYVDSHGEPTERYPLNPNGSPGGITALTNPDGRITLLMPHPERVFRAVSETWRPTGHREEGAWARLFHNARAFVG